MRRISAVVCLVVAISAWHLVTPSQWVSSQVRVQRVSAVAADDLRQWDTVVNQMTRSGELKIAQDNEDALMPGRRHERMQQLYQGILVWGGDVTRQTVGGVTVSIFGSLYDGISIGAAPKLLPEDARDIISRLSGVDVGTRLPQLLVLPLEGGGYALTYRDQAISADEASVYFIDAMDGSLRLKYSLLEHQSAVVQGVGVLGDTKKVSVRSLSGTFMADDQLRPPALQTYDMRGNLTAALNALNGLTTLTTANLAQDPGASWSDGPNVDAHVYEGLTYDYYFKKFGRRGLDNQNTRIVGMTHPVRAQDIFAASSSVLNTFYLNAFYCATCGIDRRGMMVYGEGGGTVLFGCGTVRFNVRNFAGALDVVAHELSHGVTAFTSNLIYLNESGALNEAFSDIMGTSVAFFVNPATASYVIGKDLSTTPNVCLARSLQDPLTYGLPDHYTLRFTGSGDNGGVHINSSIVNQAFYLAIEGGTNRTSRLTVQGVGAANREQIERVFYRAFTQLMPSNSTFSTARAATVQAARDLYGSGGAPERAVTQAWTAVGVN